MDSETNSHYDVVIIGTGLTESITAAALAKAGIKVLHLDSNVYYGSNEASLTLDELTKWCELIKSKQDPSYESARFYGKQLELSRQYALSLAPSLLPSRGPLISAVVNSGVARYGGFRLLECVAIYSAGIFKSVPSSKEDIFKSKEISLIEKRHLMRFLTFAAGNFEESKELEGNAETPFVQFLRNVFHLSDELANAIAYTIAFCTSIHDTTVSSLERTRHHLRSAGRYGPSPFLIAPFGGLGELVQGFCRSCAVSGGTYILGHETEQIVRNAEATSVSGSSEFTIHLKGIKESVETSFVVSSKEHITAHLQSVSEDHSLSSSANIHSKYAMGIIIIDNSISLVNPSTIGELENDQQTDSESEGRDNLDTAVFVFPPSSLPGSQSENAVNVLVYGGQTESCPRGKHVLYFSTLILPLSESEYINGKSEDTAESILRPYIEKTLSLVCYPPVQKPTYSTFYTRKYSALAEDKTRPFGSSDSIFICPPLPQHFSENGDTSALHAEKLFWEIIKRSPLKDEVDTFWPVLQHDSDDEW